MNFSIDARSTSSASAWRTAGSENSGCLVLRLERSPSTSVQGSALCSLMCSMPPPLVMATRPLPPFSRRNRISSSTCRFQAKSYSPVCNTERAAETASPPPLLSMLSKWGRIAGIFPGEDDVVGRERLAVVPDDALLQPPDHRFAVGGQRPVLAARNRRRQRRPEVAVIVPAGERLVEQPRRLAVLVAARKMRIEQGGALPQGQLQRPATPAPGRLADRPPPRHRGPRRGPKLPPPRAR